MMLNQCIFIGKLSSISTSNQRVTKLVIEVKSINNQPDKIVIEMPFEMAQQEHLKEGYTVALKARVSSDENLSYRFIAERITLLGGTNYGS